MAKKNDSAQVTRTERRDTSVGSASWIERVLNERRRNRNTKTKPVGADKRKSGGLLSEVRQLVVEIALEVWSVLYAGALILWERFQRYRQVHRQRQFKARGLREHARAVTRQKNAVKRAARQMRRKQMRDEIVWKITLVTIIAPYLFLKPYGLAFSHWLKKSSAPVRSFFGRSVRWLWRFLNEVVDEADRLYQIADEAVSQADREVNELSAAAQELSDLYRFHSEGLIQRLPLKRVGADGSIQTPEQRGFALIDLSMLGQREVRLLVNELHLLGPDVPFKIIWEGAISGTTVAEHVDWLLGEVEENRHKYREFSPNATLDFETQLRWYLELNESIRRGHRVLRPLLVVPRQSLVGLSALGLEPLRPVDLTLFLLGLFDQLSDWDDRSFREAQERISEFGVLEAVLPGNSTLDYYADAIKISKPSIWPGEEGEADVRETLMHTFTVNRRPGVTRLRQLLLPLINDERRRLYITTTVEPVPVESRGKFLNVARKHMKRITGYNAVRGKIGALEASGMSHDEASAEALDDDKKDRYREEVEYAEKIIPRRNRPAFRASPLTLLIKTYSLDDLRSFKKDVRTTLNDEGIWFDEPPEWDDQELNLHSILPCITNREVKEDSLMIPVWDLFLADHLYQEKMFVPKDGIVAGILEEDGTPLSVGLTIVACQGTHGSGKTQAAKNVAAFLRLADPGRRAIVFDNTGASARVGAGQQAVIDEARMQGWVQWAELTGGEVVFASKYVTPVELVAALEAIEDSRFIVYYPDGAKKQHDMAALGWLLGALQRFHNPKTSGEHDIQQMLVFDDILGWNADVSTPDNPGNRMEFMTQTVFNQCIATGTLTMVTLQTARAVEHADPASHEVLKAGVKTWFNFETPSHGDVATAIGMRPHTREGEALFAKTGAYMAALSPLSMGGTEDPGRCVVTIHNIEAKMGRILVHPEMLPILSRKVVK